MLDAFEAKPGLLYVVATLLPLASFALLLLVGMIRTGLRAQRESGGLGQRIYEALGGDTPRKWPAFVATAAIGLSFVCALAGFVLFQNTEHELQDLHKEIHKTEHDLKHVKQEIKDTAEDKEEELAKLTAQRDKVSQDLKKLRTEEHELESRLVGAITWANLTTRERKDKKEGEPSYTLGLNDAERGTRLMLGFRIDSLAAVMFLMVTLIATLIHVFSIGYMSDELAPEVTDHQVHVNHHHLHRRGRFGRFFMFLSLFCFSMLNLVLADNLFQIFVSWELVGVCSYLLIGFYYERTSASNAANKAFITNRVGDAGFIIGMLILWTYVGTFNFEGIFKHLRAPDADTHRTPMPLAGQIVRGDVSIIEDQKIFTVDQTNGQHALLFPRGKGHFHSAGLDPAKKDVEEADRVGVHDNPSTGQMSTMPYWLLVVAGLGIFLGCVGKSAQFPLQVWLPDAMEGPTPVSALIHAATMVAAGVYLVGRAFPLFTPEVQIVIAYTGAITLFVAATVALVQTDIKKVLAYSTVSQLGYMMLAVGVGGWVAGQFHLITHAFFKALLFLCSGAVIYNCHHEQEMTKMGGLYPRMKITALTMLVGVLAIAGTPLFSGWYSKDAILAEGMGFITVVGQRQHLLLFLLPLLTAGITTFYMFRMWYMTFTGKPRDMHVYEHAREAPPVMTVPLIILAFFSVVVAWGWPITDPTASWLEHQLHHSQPRAVTAEYGIVPQLEPGALPAGTARNPDQRLKAHENHALVGNLTLLVVILSFVFATLVYYKRVLDPADAKEQFPGVHRFLWHKWYFDEIYSALLVRPALAAANFFRAIDTYVIDGFIDWLGRFTVKLAWGSGRVDHNVVDGLVNVIGNVSYGIGARLRRVQTGYLRSYILFLALAAVGIWLLFLFFFAPAPAEAGK